MNQNAELRPPSRRDASCEPLWRYQDLAHALPPRAQDDVEGAPLPRHLGPRAYARRVDTASRRPRRVVR